MKKIDVLILGMIMIVLGSTSLAWAEICPSVITPTNNCSIVSPELGTCVSYTYEVINNDGTVIESGDLNVWNGSSYQFWFFQDVGEYQVRYCDGTTGQVFVKATQCELVKNKDVGLVWVCAGLALISLVFMLYGSLRSVEEVVK